MRISDRDYVRVLNNGGFAALNDNVLHHPAAIAAKGSRGLVFGRIKTLDALLKRIELNDDKAVKALRPLVDLVFAAACQHLAAVELENARAIQ